MSLALTKCPLCDSENHKQLYEAIDRHYGIPGVFRLVRCEACSLVFLNPMFSDQELLRLYPQDYYAYQNHFPRSRWKELVKSMLHYQMGTRDPKFPRPGRVLDLGCGSGWYLSAMRDQGWEAHGVEISKEAAELGRKQAGLNIFSGTLQQAEFPSDYFDYIRSNHSFEHIACPNETLLEIYRVLRPKGKLLIGVPNIDSLNARLFRQYWWYLGVPVHPFTYSVNTLSAFLSKSNFSVIHIAYNSDYSGILGSAQIFLNRRNGRKSSEGRLVHNPVFKVSCHWAAKVVDRVRLGDAIEITAMKTSR